MSAKRVLRFVHYVIIIVSGRAAVTRSIRPHEDPRTCSGAHVGACKCAEGATRDGGTHPVEIELGFVALSRSIRLASSARRDDERAGGHEGAK